MDHTLDDAGRDDPTAPSDATRVALDRSHARASQRSLVRRPQRQQWREEFPYHWNADELVTRRDTLRFLVGGSGALFAATAALGVVGAFVPSTSATQPHSIARVGQLPVNGFLVFTYPDQYSQGILVNLPGKGLVAYSDVCTHLSCAVLYRSELQQFHCPCHEGFFDAYTGNVLAGPPTRPLPLIELEVRNGLVYAVGEVER